MRLLFIELWMGVVIIGFTVYYGDSISRADPYALYSLLASMIIAVMLGYLFWFLQNMDFAKMQELMGLGTKTAASISDHVAKQKELQDSIRSSSLNFIKTNVEAAKEQIIRMIQYIENYEIRDQRLKAFHLDTQLQKNNIFKIYPNAVEQQLTTLRPYIQADLSQKIQNVALEMRYLWLSSEDRSDKRIFDPESPETVKNWISSARNAVKSIDEVINEIQKAEDKIAI